jgi:hypothetical protein
LSQVKNKFNQVCFLLQVHFQLKVKNGNFEGKQRIGGEFQTTSFE